MLIYLHTTIIDCLLKGIITDFFDNSAGLPLIFLRVGIPIECNYDLR